MIGGYLADVLEHPTLGGTDDVHHVFWSAPLLRNFQHLLKEPFAVGIFCHLEIHRTFVAGQCQQNDPLAVIAEEGGDGVFAHIGRDGQGIDIVLLEEGFGVHLRRVADITALGIGDDEVVGVFLLQIVDGGLGRGWACRPRNRGQWHR